MLRALAAIGRAGPAALPVGLLIGLALPDLAVLVRPLLAVLVFGMLATTMLRADPARVLGYLGRPGPLAVQVLLMMGLLPAVLAWLLPALGLPQAMLEPVVLYALSPPILAAAMVALMLGLNYPRTLVVSMVATLATPLLLPWMAVSLIGIDVNIGLLALTGRLVLMVGGALALAVTIRRLLGAPRIERYRDEISGGFVVLMTFFAISVMGIVSERLDEAPGEVLLVLALVMATNLVLQAVGLLVWPVLGRVDATSTALMVGNRNMGIVVAVAELPADSLIPLFFALAQVPIFALPLLLRPIYRRLADKPPP